MRNGDEALQLLQQKLMDEVQKLYNLIRKETDNFRQIIQKQDQTIKELKKETRMYRKLILEESP